MAMEMGMGTLMGVLMGGGVSEGTLQNRFKGSKSKKRDGKISSQVGLAPVMNSGEGLVSSAKRGMSKQQLVLKEERKTSAKQPKTGQKPTYVSTMQRK